MVAFRPHLDLRRRAPDADPRQGQGAHRAVGVLVSAATLDIVPNPLRLVDRRRCPTRCAGERSTFAGSRCCRWNASSAGYLQRLRVEGLPAGRARWCGIELPGGALRESEAAPGADLHPRNEGGGPATTTRTSTQSGRRRSSAIGATVERLARGLDRPPTGTAADHARARAGSSSPTRSSSFGWDANGVLTLGDEVLTPELLALLAGRRVRARSVSSRRSTSSTCAIGRRGRRLGQDVAGGRPSPTMSSARHAREVLAGVRADRGGEPFDALARAGGAVRGPGPDPPQGGHPRSARARWVERALPRPGVRRRGQCARRPSDRARRGGSRPASGHVREAPGEPADRGLRRQSTTAPGTNGAGA